MADTRGGGRELWIHSLRVCSDRIVYKVEQWILGSGPTAKNPLLYLIPRVCQMTSKIDDCIMGSCISPPPVPVVPQPGEFIHTLGDAHIYINHIEPLKEQVG